MSSTISFNAALHQAGQTLVFAKDDEAESLSSGIRQLAMSYKNRFGKTPGILLYDDTIRKASKTRYTYSAQLIHDFCLCNGYSVKAHSAETPGFSFFKPESGLRITFTNADSKKVYLSIQTHPRWAECAFAETAVQSDKLRAVVYPSELGYFGDVIRHQHPQALFDHINLVREHLKCETAFQNVYSDVIKEKPEPVDMSMHDLSQFDSESD